MNQAYAPPPLCKLDPGGSWCQWANMDLNWYMYVRNTATLSCLSLILKYYENVTYDIEIVWYNIEREGIINDRYAPKLHPDNQNL